MPIPFGKIRRRLKGPLDRLANKRNETRNEYQIRVYHRPQGARYDRLIGYTRCRM